jgi:hypothetical protein
MTKEEKKMIKEYKNLVDIRALIEAARRELSYDYEISFNELTHKWPLLRAVARLLDEMSYVYIDIDDLIPMGQKIDIERAFLEVDARVKDLKRDFENSISREEKK